MKYQLLIIGEITAKNPAECEAIIDEIIQMAALANESYDGISPRVDNLLAATYTEKRTHA